ncbi:MAG: hypothetical protein WDA59_05095 [Methanofastidiosum sp.]|jgi:5'(3')-deoxyribonucleotidase
MSKNLPLFFDMDEVICDFLSKLFDTYNKIYNKNIKISDIKEWSLLKYIGTEGIKLFEQPGFFSDLEPIENAIETIKILLKQNRKIFIVSSPISEHCVFDKYQWVKKYMPFFPIANLVLVGNKGDLLTNIKNGVLFDDCPRYLECFGGVSVCMDMPYNQGARCDFRVRSWEEFHNIIS